MDWEDSGWGPPLADVLRFVVAYHSLAPLSPARIAARIRESLSAQPADAIEEAARFWLQHRNLRPVQNAPELPRKMARDVARGARERAALAALVSWTGNLMPSEEAVSSR